ncbi:MAG TPA: vitamin K epoxide reductase family protein [Terracidiphilus sp.]|nr:vitamin K epoxide reductase family protein [Terracidiphilus sp.]
MRYLIAILALAGAMVSALALQVHYSTATEPCSINARWDCGVVNHSPFAVIDKVPVAAIGIAGYVVLVALALARLRFALLLAASIGFDFALWLTTIEHYVLQVWCLYCVISQGIIALILLIGLGWFAAEYWTMKRAAKRP